MEQDRLHIFRAMKSSVRGSDRHLLVGIDVAKNRHHAFFGTANGRTLRKLLVFDNSISGFESLRSLARDLKNQYGLVETVYGVEPTACYHKPLAEYLIRQEELVVYVSNVAVKKNRVLLDGRWDKNDKKDAANIADLVGQGRCLYYDVPEEHLQKLRSLIAFRTRLKRQEHALWIRLRNNIFAQYFPEMEGRYIRSGETDDYVLAIAEHCLDPREISRFEFSDFLKLISPHNIGSIKEKRLREIWDATHNSIGCLVHEEVRWESKKLVHELKAIRGILNESEQRIAKVAQKFPEYEYLLSIPGFGPIVSAMVLAAIGNPSRFENQRQVLRLAGLDLCASRSGTKSENVKPVISKQGKTTLRYALVLAATSASASNPDVRSYYSGLLKGRELESGIRLKMKIKLAAKLLVIAWTLMKRREHFKPSYFQVH